MPARLERDHTPCDHCVLFVTEGGLASGIVNTSYQVGSALGLAAMTALTSARGADQLGNAGALTDGYSAAFLGAAAIAVAGALLAAGGTRGVSGRGAGARPRGPCRG